MRAAVSRLLFFAVAACLALSSRAQGKSKAARTRTALEQRAMQAFIAARSSPLELHAFLVGMPKGADLHMHLSGAVYAETFLAEAAADNLCIDRVKLSLAANLGMKKTELEQSLCADGQIQASAALKDQKLYDDLVDSFSMRGFVPTPGVTGHDQFFATFGRFGAISGRAGEWLDEVATRAAAQNEQYLEIMQTPPFSNAAKLGYAAGWSLGGEPDHAGLAVLRDKLLAGGLRDEVAVDQAALSAALETRNRIEHCSTAAATKACSVRIHFLGQVLRAFPPQQVFAQTLLYFELASLDPEVVGINFVQPEDAYMAMSEYHRQMLMLDYLHSVYPKVHISLHAGELAPGMVPPAGLRFHIREAVELGHAERVGHGVDVMQEDDPRALLKEMADRHIMTEINLTSNDLILGVSANHHSLPAYRKAHVPVALSTDDEGVSRIDLTHEYARAATEFNLSYLELKDMARTSLEHSFMPGASLWQQPDNFSRAVAACSGQALGVETPNDVCRGFLASNEKAGQQWELERRYRIFESTVP